MRIHTRLVMPAAASLAAALLLTGCGDDDSSGGGAFDPGNGGASEGTSGGDIDGGDADGGDTDGGEGGDDGPPSFGADTSEGNPLQFRWEGENTVLVVTDDFSVLGDKALNATCPGNGNSGSLGGGGLFFSCSENEINLRSVKIHLEDDDTLTLTNDSDGSTETLTKGEDLRDQTLDEATVAETLLN
jgi:hypothetical protein